jgi:hypothetical protein
LFQGLQSGQKVLVRVINRRFDDRDARPADPVLVPFFEGTYQGEAPLSLKLAKEPPHVIRIEKDGYRPVEIRVKKRKPWLPIILGNLIWIPPIAMLGFNPDAQIREQEFARDFFPVLALCVYIGGVALDGSSSRSSDIEPRHVSIMVEKNAGGGEPKVIEWDAADFRGLHWITVSVADRTAIR